MPEQTDPIFSGAQDPRFWRDGAISTTAVMLIVLALLTIDSLDVIAAGGANVPAYTVINQEIGYEFDSDKSMWMPTIGEEQLLFGQKYDAAGAEAMMDKAKLVIQSRNCINCHTFFGNGAYYGPDLTKAWLDPVWEKMWIPMTQSKTREEAMVKFLMHPDRYPTWARQMPNLGINEEEARAVTAYQKWMSSVHTNGFPAGFGNRQEQR
ncbi:MAG: c-type cytochrome [Gammaproteobacteria bacterium]